MKKSYIILFLFIAYFNAYSQTNILTLDYIFLKNAFRMKGISEYTQYSDGTKFIRLNDKNNIVVYDYENEIPQKTLLDSKIMNSEMINREIDINAYKLSPNEKYILITSNIKHIYRHSYAADYYLWNIEKKEIIKLTSSNPATLADFSPDSKKIILISDNNIFLYNISENSTKQITKDGKRNYIINGTSDWVYEEELVLTKAYDFSVDSKYLAYIKFDESAVPEMSMTIYEDKYPTNFLYKYPKAGEANSIVTVFVYDLNSGETRKINTGNIKDIYLPRIKFSPYKNILSIIKMNRLQNKLEIIFANPESGSSETVYTEESKTYIMENYDLNFLKDGRFIRMSDLDGYAHIYLHNKNGKRESQITQGNFDISEIKGIDEKNNMVYYTAYSRDALNKSVFRINYNTKAEEILSDSLGTSEIIPSSDFSYYIIRYSNANTPYIFRLFKQNKELVKVLEDNKALFNKLNNYNFSQKEFFTFSTSENILLNGYIMKPTDFDENKKYPVLMYVYGGPGSQSVSNAYGGLEYYWSQYLCSNGYIVACVDGRGTGGRGAEFEKQIYRQMGKLEFEDQKEAAKYLGTLPYIDAERIGIWGWSFGGYMSALCITKGADYFKTAVAVAPVTNFIYYDNIYTERYMGLPSENPEGYRENSPITYANQLKGNFLIVHGSTDDNVHLQNTMEFVNELIANNKQFEMQIYPNKNHNISGGNTRYHLFKRITDFIFKNL